MAISDDIIQKLLPLLRPLMEDKKERRGHLNRALLNAAVLKRLDWDMLVDDFITDMVKKLHDFGEITSGKPALCALLSEIREYVGSDKQVHIDKLIAEVQTEDKLIVEVQTEGEFRPIQTPRHLLFDLLLQMDFKQQVRLVKQVMTLHRIAAFLVHGEPCCGQRLLVTRLLRLKPQWKNISPIQIDVSHNGVGRSIPHLRRQVASWFYLPKDTQLNEIIERVCDRLLTEDVIFIFCTVDYMPPKVLGAWLQEFWEPLVERVKTNCCPTPEGTHLLMFLVDNSGSVCQSTIGLAKQYEQPEYPRIPLHLPPVSSFPPDVLDDWLDMVTAMETMQRVVGLTSKVLLEKSDNGIPEDVYQAICDHCGHDWQGELAKWQI